MEGGISGLSDYWNTWKVASVAVSDYRDSYKAACVTISHYQNY